MKLLAWDTSSKTGALAAIEWDAKPSAARGRFPFRLVSEWTLNIDATHSERLIWAIDEVLKACRWKLEDIDVFGVGVGPGSFTGLRIGVTTARTLAHTLRKPLVGVSSLAVLVRPVGHWLAETDQKALVVGATDACKGELFALWGNARAVVDCAVMSEGDRPGVWKRGVEERVLTPEALGGALKKKLGNANWIAVGEGRDRHPDLWRKLPKASELVAPVPFSDLVQGRYVAALAWEGFQAGVAREALEVHPRYLRASDAEIKLKAGPLK